MLTNDVVSFEQPGPEAQDIEPRVDLVPCAHHDDPQFIMLSEVNTLL